MLIGVVSDTHDHLDRLRRALTRLRAEGVEHILHAGDIVSPFAAIPFEEAQMSMLGVFGNNDGDKLYLRERFAGVGAIHFAPHECELAGRRILLMHEPRAFEALARSSAYDLVIYGHTHEVNVRVGPPVVLNPGECCGWLSGRASCALVDLATLRVETIEL